MLQYKLRILLDLSNTIRAPHTLKKNLTKYVNKKYNLERSEAGNMSEKQPTQSYHEMSQASLEDAVNIPLGVPPGGGTKRIEFRV